MASERIEIDGTGIEYRIWGSGSPRVVMLHDGLGSIDQWRGTPGALAERLGVAVMAYNRPGHGGSTPQPSGRWPTRWLHDQAELLATLLDTMGVVAPLLVGHSDGGSISLIHASSGAGCAGVVALAPHSFVEQMCVDAISAMRSRPDRIVASLAPFHADAKAIFEAWSGVWVSDEFARWDIRDSLGAVSCPTLVAQGDDDAYATDDQLQSTVAAIGSNARAVALHGFGHLIHHQSVDRVVDLVAELHVSAPGPEA